MSLDELISELRSADRSVLHLLSDPGAPAGVALLAGSFDPLTVGHEALARAASQPADLVILVYSVKPLSKEGPVPPPLLREAERLHVLERFCRARPGMAVGLASRGLLAEQLAAARDRFPQASISLVMGSDKVLQLLDPHWYEDREAVLSGLFREARVLYAVRAGEEGAVEVALDRAENTGWRDRFERVPVPPELASVSSRLVRERVRRGEDVGHLVPPEALRALRGEGSRPAGIG
jgi:nicotinic acid mononucleotide adenylyltransferase